MTLELVDGRGELFQWDTGRIVEFGEDAVSQAHFTNTEKVIDIPYTVEVKNRKAAIPDELLQVPGTLIVYAWVTDTNGSYTKVQVNFPVFARPKPSDYVYTPTEHAGFDRLRAEIGDLSALQTDAKDNLVDAINEAAASGGASDSVLYTAQTLSDEQKKQARENVGAEESHNGMRKKELYYQLQASDEKQSFVVFIKDGDITQFEDSEPDNSDIRKAFATLASVLGADSGVEYLDSDFQERTRQLYAAYQAGLLQLPLRCYANPYYTQSQAIFIDCITFLYDSFIVNAVYKNGSGFHYEFVPSRSEFENCTYTGPAMRVNTANALTTTPSIPQFAMSADPTENMQIATKKYVDGEINMIGERLYYCPYTLMAEQGNYGYWYIAGKLINEWYTKIKEEPSNYPILCLYKGPYNIKYEYEGPLFLDAITDTEIVYKRTLEDGSWVGFKLSAVDGSPSKNGFIKGVSKELILSSSTADSTKKFKITVDDSGTITTMEV